MRLILCLLVALTAVAGCARENSAAVPTATARPATSQPTAIAHHPVPTATPVISQPYAAFVNTICRAFAARDAGTIINSLPYYQYNSGLRYGNLGDGEGQTGDPSLMRTWLAGAHVRCTSLAPDAAGHGTVLTSGWTAPNLPWSLLELDTFNGHWKINDFTFGRQAALYNAMQTSGPILAYRG